VKTFRPRVSSKGQITIPVEIREHLGVHAHDSISIIVNDDGSVELKAPEYTLERIFGSVPDLPNTTPDLDREIDEAMEEFYQGHKKDLRPW
jgi:AbrB family looped-hinge helix DNA binding protein